MEQVKAEIKTFGELKSSGYRMRSVKEELRENLVVKLRAGTELFPGILGFDDTVIPQLQHAILGKHDFILLGLRGQAKTRLIRMLPTLLDVAIPVVAGSDLNDNPFAPISKYARDRLAAMGDDTPIEWLPRAARYSEKLATPDTSIADLIGDIDPIKAAHHRLTYADEEVIHFGIIPRTNRGIFAINELPDLQPRIQVGLLNIMEEQDIQIRGFNIRFPLDLLMVFSANPEDYTNRGNIITPLKDRIDAQIITHYPRTLATGMRITRQEAWHERGDSTVVHVPGYVREIVEQIAFEARQSEYVDQKSGVSARMTRATLESLVSAAERRALIHGESETTVRPSDLVFAEPAITGKIELVYEGEQEGAQTVARLLVGRAVKAIFATHFPDPSDKRKGRSPYERILSWFAGGGQITMTADMAAPSYRQIVESVPGLHDVVTQFGQPKDLSERTSMMEWVLEALHQHSLLGKESIQGHATFTDMMGSMLASFNRDDGDDAADDAADGDYDDDFQDEDP